MFRKKRKFDELDNTSSNDNIPRKRRRNNNNNRTFNTLSVKKTFARNRKNKTTTKHLHKSVIEPISDDDDDDDDIDTNYNPKCGKYGGSKRINKVQSTLDFPIIKELNDKFASFNKCGPSHCNDCGMLYYSGRNEDDSLHSKFHKSFMNKFNNGYNASFLSKFIIWNFQNIMKNSSYFIENERKKTNKKYKQMKIGKNGESLEEIKDIEIQKELNKNRNDLILCIKYNDFIDLKKRNIDILSVVDIMDRDLGYFTTKQLKYDEYLKQNEYINDRKDNNEEIVYSLDKNQSLYCFVEKTGHKIVGCVVCEPVEFAYKIKIKTDIDNDDNVERHDLKQKCYIGIVKIWVHHEFRRKYIASVLIDCIRKTFIYATEIHKKYIAFCQPTRIGQQFAEKYCKTKHILVY